ncbi:FAD-dependent monooxygenase [Bradyrhizobium mercantei]|uniref:FAD-dependent monooxygenase n=1 Tax=Bradyrhizobium mercantei TaxID=1904807 RepID=UPI000975CD5E|nr:FAD-dependent monooxygenase [Bradyrhizobium mercantei]
MTINITRVSAKQREDMVARTEFDVAVIGYGPTDLTAASLLGQLGLQVVMIERWQTLHGRPRLTHIDGETARLLSFACDINEALRESSPTRAKEV